VLIAAGAALLYWAWIGFGGSDNGGGNATADCPSGWNRFDDTARHFRVCLPPTLVYYDGSATHALANVDKQDTDFQKTFMVVNLGWINTWPAQFPSDPLIAPLSLRFQTATASTSFDNCNPRSATADDNGVRACSDRLTLDLNHQPVPAVDGFIHIYKALVPINGASADSSRDLYVLVDSPNAVWSAQQPVVDQIIGSIETY